jgi:hypothetical protein
MCEWGTNERVVVTIAAQYSCTGKARKASTFIDACIAPIVAALESAGIYMHASCCGHGKGTGRIDLADGRVLEIHANETSFHGSRKEEGK